MKLYSWMWFSSRPANSKLWGRRKFFPPLSQKTRVVACYLSYICMCSLLEVSGRAMRSFWSPHGREGNGHEAETPYTTSISPLFLLLSPFLPFFSFPGRFLHHSYACMGYIFCINYQRATEAISLQCSARWISLLTYSGNLLTKDSIGSNEVVLFQR